MPDHEALVVPALAVVMAFGPERSRPETARLHELVPAASPEQVAAALREAHAAQDRAYALTERCWPLRPLPEHEFRTLSDEVQRELADEHPLLPPDTIKRLVSQAHYFHAK